ncbi:MAG: DUF3179 domain-containing protein [SAR324 cluster bacterium]|nr:DUF3179 domain-containing protein [SAR324 cluster bacterium]
MQNWWLIIAFVWPYMALGQTDSSFIQQWRKEGWTGTNFYKSVVPYEEIISGGPPRDGIPPIYEPKFETVENAQKWLPDSEPVIVHKQGEKVRAYPYRILIWHEIVNDQIDGKSFIVTFCPLCNSAIVYNTHFQGVNHKFGVSGKLRNSDMVMWDHTTESWWQQLTGEAIVGDAVGTSLEMLPSPAISFGSFKSIFPQGKILSQDTAVSRPYGDNPYVGYDQSKIPFLMRGDIDQRLPPLSRVIGIEWNGKFYTLPLREIAKYRWGRIEVEDGQELVVFNLSSANSSLNQREIADSQLVDQVTVWENPEKLKFVWDGTHLRDSKENRQWNAMGQGGNEYQLNAQLISVKYGVHFAFAWLAFHPDSVFLKL